MLLVLSRRVVHTESGRRRGFLVPTSKLPDCRARDCARTYHGDVFASGRGACFNQCCASQ